ncbi:biotin/lipoyl-binding protein, partial [Rhodoferax sp.]|uniref:biotin/lipoyl-binding protein n=1 Tax=Rhodoferax sp. TaxID=50421 RepID=UPI002762D761|nr:biotin/lipoyl-binding protein [Rhodoferax sp.]
MSPTLIRRLVIASLVLLLLALGLWWINRPKPVSVTLWQIDQGRVEASVANTRAGTVEACQRTKLSATMGGRIEVLAVKEGDKVKKGQLLMKLWNDDQQAQSTLAMAQVETTRKRVTEVCTMALNAENEADRQGSLRSQGFVSGSREEQARAEAQAR